jgi:receptor expression-enhancing protein 5/6
MDKIKETLAKNTGFLDPIGAKLNVSRDLAAYMGVNSGAPLFLVGLFLMLLLTYLYSYMIMVTAITILYPALKSIRAIETPGKEDDKTWLTYWMVFGTFVVLETFVGFLLQLIPYWSVLRLVFFIWLLFPAFNGADILYVKVMRPMLKDHRDKIQELI